MISNHFLNYQSETEKKPIKEFVIQLKVYTTGSLLDYNYFLNHYKLIAIDLSRQDIGLTKQQINFIGKLSQDATTFFIIEKTEKTTLKFSQNFVDIV